MNELVFKDECYVIYGICYGVQNEFGSALKEKQYQDIFEAKLKFENVPYEREKELHFVLEDGTKIKGNIVDFIVFNKIAVDLKSKPMITKDDFRQMKRYLKAGGYKLGLVINFRGSKVIIKRVLNSDIRK